MKRISLLLFGLALLLSACATAPRSDTPGLTFVHLNDTYRVGAVEDGNAGGFSRVVTVVRELQSNGRDVRILHGGDFLYPSLESQLWNGMQMVDAFNFMDAVAPMYAVAGNHEFDRRGPEQLIAAVTASRFDWLGDNYVFRTGDAAVDGAMQSAFTFQAGDKTIGVFSLTLNAKDGGNKRDYLENNGDYMGVARKTIATLESKGVDLIIGVTHLHMWQDVELAGLKAEHPKLAFIVGGHEHEPEHSPGSDTSAVVMKGASNARVIWAIDIDFDGAGKATVRERKIKLDEKIALDPEYEILANKWRGRLLEKFRFSRRELAPRRCRSTGARSRSGMKKATGAISSLTRCVPRLASHQISLSSTAAHCELTTSSRTTSCSRTSAGPSVSALFYGSRR